MHQRRLDLFGAPGSGHIVMRPSLVRQRIAAGRTVLNGWCSIASSHVAEAIGHQGFDSVTIDLQHGAIDYSSAFTMLQAISTTPAMPIVRVPWNEPGILMKMLDCGAYGIICPMIDTAGDAEAFVGACRYPPRGYRSYGPNRALLYAGDDYARHADGEIILLAQIETSKSLGNLAEILAVPGLDGVYVGPGDLSLSLGATLSFAPTAPAVVSAMDSILRATRAKGLIAGVHTDGPETALKRFAEGFHLCTMRSDMGMLIQAARLAVRAVKGERA